MRGSIGPSSSLAVNFMLDRLYSTLQSQDHLSASVYDVAACALYDGENRDRCVQWIHEHYQRFGGWGERFSWQDRYLSTYSAGLALIANGETDVGYRALRSLATIPARFPGNKTTNVGGVIAALDAWSCNHLHHVIQHPDPVQEAITADKAKWSSLLRHDLFYDPRVSTLGFLAEWAYVEPSIDLVRLLENFQVGNGSISFSPSGSAFCLMACDEASYTSESVEWLRYYVEHLDPWQREIGMLDQAPHFVTAWALLNLPPDSLQMVPEIDAISTLRQTISRPEHLVSICDGDITFPGDMDTTSCAIIGLNLPEAQRRKIFESLEDMFDTHHYLTFRHERTASVTTNVHAVAAWPHNPHNQQILGWLTQQLEDARGLPVCKWHTSPYYTLGEIGRLFPAVGHAAASSLAARAGKTLLARQLPNGGWGWQGVTGEETCYAILALQELGRYGLLNEQQVEESMDRARQFLTQHPPDHSRLWIGKSLYFVKPLEQWLRFLALEGV